MNEEDIIRRLQEDKDDANALNALWKLRGDFRGWYLNHGWNESDSDALLNAALLKIIVSCRQCKTHARGWMWTIVKRTALDEWRKRENDPLGKLREKSAKEFIQEADTARTIRDEGIESEIDDLDVRECVDAAMADFTQDNHVMGSILEWFQDGVDQREIADRIGKSYAATRKIVGKAKKLFMPYAFRCNELLA